MPKMPTWNPPKNIVEALENSDGSWEDERYSPILVTAMSGTEYNGREIPVAWQIEFDPSDDEFEAANARLEAMDIEPDGYGWGVYIQKAIRKTIPALAKRLHTTDCENATCVIWVESEEDCRELLEATWKLVFNENTISPASTADELCRSVSEFRVKWTFWFVTYNGMGGHPVLSFAPNILLAADGRSFGTAIDEFEICAHVEPAHGPPPGSDYLITRFRDRLPTLPKSWFRRKKKRVEIAYHSHAGCAEDLLGGDFAAKKVPDVVVLRRTCEEVATSLSLLKRCIKRSDEFDVGGFLDYVEAKTLEFRALDDGEVLRRLSKAQAAERERVARTR